MSLNKNCLQYAFLLILFTTVPCPLKADAKSVRPPESQKAAVLTIRRLAMLFRGAQSLAFSCRMQSNTPDGEINIIRGFAEKPNKFRLDETVNGKPWVSVISDGKAVYIYQATSNHYRKMTALKAYDNPQEKAVREQTTDLLGNAFVPILMFFSNDANLADFMKLEQTASKGIASYSASKIRLDGVDVTRVTERVTVRSQFMVVPAGFQYDIDTKTGLLREIRYGLIDRTDGSFHYLLRSSFTSFRLETIPMPVSVFNWGPPSSATLESQSQVTPPSVSSP